MTVVLTEPAERELKAAAEWWAEHHSVDQAVRWYTSFTAALEGLATHPLQHPLARENDHFEAEIRALHFGVGRRLTHRAIYTITHDIVLVLTIRHGAQDDITPGDLDV